MGALMLLLSPASLTPADGRRSVNRFTPEKISRPRFLTAGDDSGVDANVALNVRMVKGRRYTIRVRMHFVSGDGAGLIIV